MIFLTVGTQLPFDRLARAVDEWYDASDKSVPVFGQVGVLGPDSYRPKHFEWAQQISPDAFTARVKAARVMVGHAGMGSIISAMTYRTPTLIMARRADLGEHRNDHQKATVARFQARPGLYAVADETAVSAQLNRLLNLPNNSEKNPDAAEDLEVNSEAASEISPYAQETLLQRLRDFIHKEAPEG